jgi:hypothetical protein
VLRQHRNNAMSPPTETLPPYYMQGGAINNRVMHTDRPWLVPVTQADPNFQRDKRPRDRIRVLGAAILRGSQQARRVCGLLRRRRVG